MSKLKKEELSRAQELTSRYNESVQQIGLLHVAQQDVMVNINTMKLELDKLKKELQDSYGNVEVDLKTGEITEIPTDVEDKKD
jgi:regulator of replication initiation timing|tara:strand:+ start:155 stop:403 length:249 start_codon:yes stop_codon:yes gene_type:complete